MKMPRPVMPRPASERFDFDAALIEYQSDTTDAAREKYPELQRVWDELDELRACTSDQYTVPADEYEDLEKDMTYLRGVIESAAARVDKLVADDDMSGTVQTSLESISDDLWAAVSNT
ncbi:MAG: hypothetical protein Unbinned3138contig1000_67 [Prokaryotic dsDNA virus sp.]|nr:MAG: hypothetical protein Unbinned3138contig1000_67 [Prokaryotic dsDNA virus sp.]|tara:strand:+ start:116 stop:469 length:354 start_codon:yes stop_codon:yes gene_type:complete